MKKFFSYVLPTYCLFLTVYFNNVFSITDMNNWFRFYPKPEMNPSELSTLNRTEMSSNWLNGCSDQRKFNGNGESVDNKVENNIQEKLKEEKKVEEPQGELNGVVERTKSLEKLPEETQKETESKTEEAMEVEPSEGPQEEKAEQKPVEPKEENSEPKSEDTDETKEEEEKAEVEKKEEEEEEVEPEEDVVCDCKPSCHSQLLKVTNQLELTRAHLGELISMAKHNPKSDLANLATVLSDIAAYGQRKLSSLKHLSTPFYSVEPEGKKRKSRGSATAVEASGSKEPERKSREKKVESPEQIEPMTEAKFKSINGLAVFAKWPNSGWYYPGKVEGLTSVSNWKEETNVTVKFYDGLVREMKNINILPAHLIPTECIVCDLEYETEMVVVSSKLIDNNDVEFTLTSKAEPNSEFKSYFNKLAIKAVHMKTIKQQLEPNTDVTAKKMHMVSLDNLVSGRRSRGRTNKDDDDEIKTESSPAGRRTRKSARKAEEPSDEKEEENPEVAEEPEAEAPSTKATKRRSSSEAAPSTPKRSRRSK